MREILRGDRLVILRGVCFLLTALSLVSVRAETMRFGPEFVLCNPAEKDVRVFYRHMKKHLTVDQPDGSKFTVEKPQHGHERIVSPNGWWISAYPDSGCLEVLSKPMTVEEFKRFQSDMQDAIFASGAATGFYPLLWQGGGHINIDLHVFRKDLNLYRNFIVDLLNHNELFMGIFEFNTNAGYPHELKESNPEKALELIERDKERGRHSFARITEHFQMNLHGRSFSFNNFYENRFEIRAVRPQASMDVWVRQIELLEARVRYLEKIPYPIAYQPRVPWNFKVYETLKPPVDPQAALRSFYVYVTEAGLRWQDHNDYLWPMWVTLQPGQSETELQKFETSEWFLQQERKHLEACEIRLAGGG